MNLKLGIALTLVLFPAFTLPATLAAEPAPSPHRVVPSIDVRYGDLDLSTQAGMRELHRRLANAAWQVCSKMLSNPVSIEGGNCRRELVAGALQDINRLRLASGNSSILR